MVASWRSTGVREAGGGSGRQKTTVGRSHHPFLQGRRWWLLRSTRHIGPRPEPSSSTGRAALRSARWATERPFHGPERVRCRADVHVSVRRREPPYPCKDGSPTRVTARAAWTSRLARRRSSRRAPAAPFEPNSSWTSAGPRQPLPLPHGPRVPLQTGRPRSFRRRGRHARRQAPLRPARIHGDGTRGPRPVRRAHRNSALARSVGHPGGRQDLPLPRADQAAVLARVLWRRDQQLAAALPAAVPVRDAQVR